jgi:hypothetical protein
MAQMDSTQPDGTQAANPDASPPAVQPSSFDPVEFAKTLRAQILAEIRDPKEVQSLKDRAIAEIKKDKGLKEAFAELKQMQDQGLSDAEIAREIRFRELESHFTSNPAPSAQSAGRVVEQTANDPAMTLLSAFGLDANDPEVTGILTGDDLAGKVAQIAALAQRKKQTPSNPALIAQPSGGGSAQKTLQQEYDLLAKSARGMALIDLKMEYRRRGLDIS